MAYKDFSFYYDYFNSKADYDSLFRYIDGEAEKYNCKGKILCDLGRGTGELALRFCDAGYDVAAVEYSDGMLNVLYDKKFRRGADNLLILKQDITMLDMYGTADVFTCTYDTVNHLDGRRRVERLFSKVRLFMHPDGIFIFDANTPYKHLCVLGDREFSISGAEAECRWKNTLFAAEHKTKISISVHDRLTGENHREEFFEYYYDLEEITQMLKTRGLEVVRLADGESFGEAGDKSQRYIFTVKKERHG